MPVIHQDESFCNIGFFTRSALENFDTIIYEEWRLLAIDRNEALNKAIEDKTTEILSYQITKQTRKEVKREAEMCVKDSYLFSKTKRLYTIEFESQKKWIGQSFSEAFIDTTIAEEKVKEILVELRSLDISLRMRIVVDGSWGTQGNIKIATDPEGNDDAVRLFRKLRDWAIGLSLPEKWRKTKARAIVWTPLAFGALIGLGCVKLADIVNGTRYGVVLANRENILVMIALVLYLGTLSDVRFTGIDLCKNTVKRDADRIKFRYVDAPIWVFLVAVAGIIAEIVTIPLRMFGG